MRPAIYKCDWVGWEARPEACATASILASRLPHAKVQGVATVNATVNYLRSTAPRPIIFWGVGPKELMFVSMSDAGGIGSSGPELDGAQGAWLVVAAEGPWRISASSESAHWPGEARS